MNFKRGQIGIWTAIIGGAAMVTASGITGWFSASSAIQNKISAINTEVQVTKTTEELHYKELKEGVSEMRSDIKTILKLLGQK